MDTTHPIDMLTYSMILVTALTKRLGGRVEVGFEEMKEATKLYNPNLLYFNHGSLTIDINREEEDHGTNQS